MGKEIENILEIYFSQIKWEGGLIMEKTELKCPDAKS